MAYILANDNVDIDFNMKIECQRKEEGVPVEIKVVPIAGSIDDLVESLKHINLIKKTKINKGQSRDLHELTGSFDESQGLQMLAIILAKKIDIRRKVYNKLEELGIECPKK